MGKVKEYLKNLFENTKERVNDFFTKKQNPIFINCRDFYGNDVSAPNNMVLKIYKAERILEELQKSYKEFEAYVKMNADRIDEENLYSFAYHDTLYNLSNHLALLGYYQSLIKKDAEEDRREDVDIIAYNLMVDENSEVEKIANQAFLEIEDTLYEVFDIKNATGGKTHEFWRSAEIGLIFQQQALIKSFSEDFEFYKCLKENDRLYTNTDRVESIKKAVFEIVNKKYLVSAQDEDIDVKTL